MEDVKNKILPVEEVDENEQIAIRKEKLDTMRANGFDPFQEVKFEKTADAKDILGDYAKYDCQKVKMAGRIMSKRIMGKASFSHIYDGTASMQLYFRIDGLPEGKYDEYKKLDIGDIIGFEGEVFTTHKGEISVKVSDYILLSKSLRPLPEKYHGLTNQDLRYRQRHR